MACSVHQNVIAPAAKTPIQFPGSARSESPTCAARAAAPATNASNDLKESVGNAILDPNAINPGHVTPMLRQ